MFFYIIKTSLIGRCCKLWSLLEIYVNLARISEDLSDLHSVGMDETSVAKGHDYITLFVDLQKKKTVYVVYRANASNFAKKSMQYYKNDSFCLFIDCFCNYNKKFTKY